MPFLALPRDDSLLRFEDGQVTFHYLVSTPSHPTFVWARKNSALLATSLLPSTTASTPTSTGVGVELDPAYPLVLFLPSECFSVAHLFSSQLASPLLSSRFNLVAVDPRGHGLTKDVPISQTSGRKYDLDVKAADCLDFTRLLLGAKEWKAGMHIVACSMSGLVAARMASAWPGAFSSIMITSPILERESEFMVESFQGIKELLEESWHSSHPTTPTTTTALDKTDVVKLPGEVVQGFTFRWAGSERIPAHISSYLSRTWLERLVLHPQGLEAARDWWFDLYWLRAPMPPSALDRITCDILVVEGDRDLPYDRKVGEEIGALFPHANSVRVETVQQAPFLLSVKRPDELTRELCDFLGLKTEGNLEEEEKVGMEVMQGMERMLDLDAEERFELVKVYAPYLVADSDDDEEDSDGSDSDGEEEEESSDEEDADTPLRLRIHSVGGGHQQLIATRSTRAGSAGSLNNHFVPQQQGKNDGKETGVGPVVRTLQETHL